MLQPLTEMRLLRSRKLAQALELADPATGGVEAQDPLLGVAGGAAREPVS